MDGYLKFIVLKILAKAPFSGYKLMQHIKQATGKKPSPGSIYPLLKSLKEKGLLMEKKKERSKIYTLTARGRRATREISDHHQKMAEAVQQNIRMIQNVMGDHDKGLAEIMNRVKKGTAPFGSLTQEFIQLRDALIEVSGKPLDSKQQDELRKLILTTIRQVKALAK
ncbi:MAG: PadR family transcriptional regulator [Nanoarchaeota archaeon]